MAGDGTTTGLTCDQASTAARKLVGLPTMTAPALRQTPPALTKVPGSPRSTYAK